MYIFFYFHVCIFIKVSSINIVVGAMKNHWMYIIIIIRE